MVEDSAAGEAYIGTKCIRIRSTAASGDGAAYQNLTVKAGKKYVFPLMSEPASVNWRQRAYLAADRGYSEESGGRGGFSRHHGGYGGL